ncbi:propanediol utilization protein [Paracoccus sp. p4-l81]|uniref:propanediol utilization protein n=1 Tax=Paracoccus sp. p4-l81 TaxID=3342806 RepID=UPI0035BB57E0
MAQVSGHVVRVPGHFGEWMQGRLGSDGPVVLITMACARLGLTAWHGAAAAPDQRLARLSAALGHPVAPVHLRLRAAPGLGTGISTASLIAAARLSGWRGRPADLAHACLAAEGASDPLMFPQPDRLLWASRRGVICARLPALPAHEVIGGFFGPPRPTDPADQDFPDIADLVTRWQGCRDLPGFAALASESATRTLARRGGQGGDPMADLARDLGALGWQIAHTGAARGLIFAPGTVPPHARAALQAAGLRGILRFRGGGR